MRRGLCLVALFLSACRQSPPAAPDAGDPDQGGQELPPGCAIAAHVDLRALTSLQSAILDAVKASGAGRDLPWESSYPPGLDEVSLCVVGKSASLLIVSGPGVGPAFERVLPRSARPQPAVAGGLAVAQVGRTWYGFRSVKGRDSVSLSAQRALLPDQRASSPRSAYNFSQNDALSMFVAASALPKQPGSSGGGADIDAVEVHVRQDQTTVDLSVRTRQELSEQSTQDFLKHLTVLARSVSGSEESIQSPILSQDRRVLSAQVRLPAGALERLLRRLGPSARTNGGDARKGAKVAPPNQPG